MKYLIIGDYEVEANPHLKELIFTAETADEVATGITSFTYAVPITHHNMSLILLTLEEHTWLERDLRDSEGVLKLVF